METGYTRAVTNVMDNLPLGKKFGDCSQSTQYDRLVLLQSFLSWLTRGEEAELLKMYFSKPSIQKHIPQIFPPNTLSEIMKNIQECYDNTDKHNRSSILSLVSNQFTAAQLHKFNFNFSDKTYHKAKAMAESHDFKLKKSVVKKRNYIKDDVLIQLLTFFINHSKCSKKEHVKINQKIPDDCYTKASYNPRLVYTSKLSKFELFTEYTREYPKLMSRASFYRYFPSNLKTPTK